MNQTHLYNATVTKSQPSTYNDGDITQGAQSTSIGRLEEHVEVIKMSGGEEREASHKFATDDKFEIHSKVFLPGTNVATPSDALTVLRRKTAPTLDGSYRFYIHWIGR